MIKNGFNGATNGSESVMLLNEVVRARIDKETKEQAEAVLAAIGLTLSDAIRLMLIRVAREKALPFNPLIPNEETIEAMREARAGKLRGYSSVDELLAGLNDDEDDLSNDEVQTGLQAGKRQQAR
jgi:DNA-damage-inducible protein J